MRFDQKSAIIRAAIDRAHGSLRRSALRQSRHGESRRQGFSRGFAPQFCHPRRVHAPASPGLRRGHAPPAPWAPPPAARRRRAEFRPPPSTSFRAPAGRHNGCRAAPACVQAGRNASPHRRRRGESRSRSPWRAPLRSAPPCRARSIASNSMWASACHRAIRPRSDPNLSRLAMRSGGRHWSAVA